MSVVWAAGMRQPLLESFDLGYNQMHLRVTEENIYILPKSSPHL